MIAGLGNPGRRYVGTRHNLGFMVVDAFQRKLSESGAATAWRAQSGAELAEGRLGGNKFWLLKPLSYMNRSGQPIAQWLQFYKNEIESLIVVHDDLDLDFGRVRIKQGGGHGGHNGLRSISANLGGDDYVRVRIGIGRPVAPRLEMDIADWVLSGFSKEEAAELDSIVERGVAAVVTVLEEGLQVAQNRHN